MPKRACAGVFTLYIQNIKLEGVNRTFFGIYISSGVNGLEKNGLVWGLDKILENRAREPESKRRHPVKSRECRLIFYFDRNEKSKAREMKEKNGNDSQNGEVQETDLPQSFCSTINLARE
jgi:hypothetical protein